MSKQSVIVLALLILFSVPAFADNPTPAPLYDIQCGCYSHRANAARLALRLQELGLSWYSLQMELCTRFIVDVNVDYKGRSTFIAAYPEFTDAFLVDNYWDLPRPHPEEISPLPTREKFTAIMAPYMQRQYQNGYYNRKRVPLARQRATMYTGEKAPFGPQGSSKDPDLFRGPLLTHPASRVPRQPVHGPAKLQRETQSQL